MAHQPSWHAAPTHPRQPFEFDKQRFLRPCANPRLGEKSCGVSIGLVLILAAQTRGQHARQHIGDPDTHTRHQAPHNRRQRHADRVLPREIDHPPPCMAQGDMAQLMGDHAGQLLSCDLTRAILVVKAPRQENAPIGGGQPVDRLNLVDIHPDTLEP